MRCNARPVGRGSRYIRWWRTWRVPIVLAALWTWFLVLPSHGDGLTSQSGFPYTWHRTWDSGPSFSATRYELLAVDLGIGLLVTTALFFGVRLMWKTRPRRVALFCGLLIAFAIPTLTVVVRKISMRNLDARIQYAFDRGHFNEAQRDAELFIANAHRYGSRPELGTGIHDSLTVLGLIALQKGDILGAEAQLRAAGNVTQSGHFTVSRPNMSLAKALAERGRFPATIEYLELCRTFWTTDGGRLDRWSDEARAGRVPEFGRELLR